MLTCTAYDTQGENVLKAARMDRRLEYNQHTQRVRAMEFAQLQEDIADACQYWTDNCVRCFAAGDDFDHAKVECSAFTRDLVHRYRYQVMRNDLGRPQCFYCFLPLACCGRWAEPGGGIASTPGTAKCTWPHVVLDAWACLWELCPKAKEAWLDRIRQESGDTLDGENEDDFRQYFKTMVTVGVNKVGRICYDVTWLTKSYFLEGESRWGELVGSAAA